jgi:hypothetical protein
MMRTYDKNDVVRIKKEWQNKGEEGKIFLVVRGNKSINEGVNRNGGSFYPYVEIVSLDAKNVNRPFPAIEKVNVNMIESTTHENLTPYL